jgi:hypothetical protein
MQALDQRAVWIWKNEVIRIWDKGVKLPAYKAGLPGHAVASRMRAKEVYSYCAP